MADGGPAPWGLKETLLQKVQPPMPLVPSRLGQVKPASMRELVHPLAIAAQQVLAEGADPVAQDAG